MKPQSTRESTKPTESPDVSAKKFASHERQRVRIDGRFLAIILAVFCGLGAGTHLLHSMQMDRNAKSLKELAKEARTAGDSKKEAEFFVQYLRFRPDDQDARISLANAYARVSRTTGTQARVLQLLEIVLRDAPEREDAADIRRRAIDLSIDLRRYSGALLHIANLRLDAPERDAAELAALEAKCAKGTGRYREATLKYLEAIQFAEGHVDYYVQLADVLQEHPESVPRRPSIEKSVPKLDAEFKKWFPARRKLKAPAENPQKEPKTKQKPQPKLLAKTQPKPQPKPVEEPELSRSEIVEKIYGRLAGIRAEGDQQEVPGKGLPRHSALLARSLFYMERNGADDLQRAIADAEQAQKLAPDDAKVLRHSVELAMTRAGLVLREPVKKSDLDSAITEYRKTLKLAEDLALKGDKLPKPEGLQFSTLLSEIDRKRVGMAKGGERDTAIQTATDRITGGLKAIEDYRISKSDVGLSPDEADLLLKWQIELQTVYVDLLLDLVRNADGGIDKVALDKYRNELSTLAQLGSKTLRMGVYYAQTLMFEEKWQKALQVLNAARQRLEGHRNARRRLDLAIAECHHQLNNTTARIQALRDGLNVDGTWHAGRLLLARILADHSRFTEATQHFQVLLGQGITNAIIPALRMQVRQQTQISPEKRNLLPLQKQIQAAAKRQLDDVAISLLRIDVTNLDHSLAAQDRFNAMRGQLETALQGNSQSIELLATRARLELSRPGRPPAVRAEAAMSLLRDAQKKFANPPFLMILSQAEIADRLPKDKAKTVLDDLGKQTKAFSKAEKHQLLQARADSYAQAGFPAESLDCLKRIAKLSPNNIAARMAVAMRVLAEDEADKQLKAIRGIEGAGREWGNYLEAMMLVARGSKRGHAQVASLADSKLTPYQQEVKIRAIQKERRNDEMLRAHRLLTRAARLQPQRPEFWRQLGLVATLLGDKREASENYERAIELGDRSSVAFSTVYLYKSSIRDDIGAGEILDRASRTAASLLTPGSKLANLGLQHAFRHGEYQRMQRFLPKDGSKFHSNIAQGLMKYAQHRALPEHLKTGKRGQKLLQEAREYHEKAVQVAPESPVPWISLVSFLSRIDQAKEAELTIQKAMKSLPDDRKAITVARCYTLLRNFNEAEKSYLLAHKTSPTNADVQLELVRFYSAYQQSHKAAPFLEQLLAKDSKATDRQKAAARELKVISVASSGRYADMEAALNKLDSLDRSRLSDLMTRVKILQRSPLKKDRRALIEVLRRIDERKPLTEGNRYQLARLYEQTGNWNKAEATIKKLLETDAGNRIYLSWYAGAILRNERDKTQKLKAAKDLLARLREAAVDWVGTAALECRILHAEGRHKDKDAAEVMTQWTNRYLLNRKKLKPSDAGRLKIAAELCEELNLDAAADEILKSYAQLSEQPENSLALATFYGRRARYSEGLDLCKQAVKSCSPEAVAVTAANVVALGTPPRADLQTAETLVENALKSSPKSLRIQAAQASMLTSLGRLEDAEKSYRQIHKLVPQSVAMANNLAWLLAMRSGSLPAGNAEVILEDAEMTINGAIARTGPVAELLDTRAIVYLRAGKFQDALLDLKAAVVENDRNATYFFHLAQAQFGLNDRAGAANSLHKAVDLGLSLSTLHPLEHTPLQTIAKATGVTIE